MLERQLTGGLSGYMTNPWILTTPSCPDTNVWKTWLSQWLHPSLTVAIDLGLLQLLNTSPGLTAESITTKLHLCIRGVNALLAVLVATDYLTKHDGKYYLSEQSRNFLLPDSPFYWGNMLISFHGSSFHHERLKTAIEQDKVDFGVAQNWEDGQLASKQDAQKITHSMHSHSLAAATGLARCPQFKALQIRKLLDVAGGSGCFSVALAQHSPLIHCTIMELSEVVDTAVNFIEKGGVSERVDTLVKNMFKDPWPTPSDCYDGVFFSNIFHDWSHEQNLFLAQSAFNTLVSGGKILLHEILFNESGDGPLVAALFSMHMLVYTRGKQYTFTELKELLTKVGFVDVQVFPSYGYYSIVTAKKP